ncbi:MAG: hypothetical protein ACKOEY_11640, partial [Phenylobacterium sp.]
MSGAAEADREALALAVKALASDAGPADLAEAVRTGRARIWMGEASPLSRTRNSRPDSLRSARACPGARAAGAARRSGP